MKNTAYALLLLGCVYTTSAMSAPIANLKIDGTITPPSCLINSGDEIDIVYQFKITPGLFPATGNLTLPSQTKGIEIICDASTYLGIQSVRDARAGTELTSDNFYFGLGLYNDTVKVGFYEILFDNIKYKVESDSTEIASGLFKPGYSTYTSFRIDKTAGAYWAKGTSGATLAVGKIFTADVSVTPTLNGALKTSDGTAELDGHAILAFAFGI